MIFAELNRRSMCSVSRNTAGPAIGLVRADALEHAGAVVQRVREDVDLGVVPRNELAVHPDLLGRGDGHPRALRRRLVRRLQRRGDRVADLRGRAFSSSVLSTAFRIRAAASASPRKSHIMAAEITAARGSALPVPAMSGAEPWTGSNSYGPVRAGLRLAEAARPIPPAIAPPRSVRMSPKRLSVTITS